MYKHVTIAGTFDHFHTGHKYLIDLAFNDAEKVSVGIAEESLYSHKSLASIIEPLEVRMTNVTNYLQQQNYAEKAEIFTLKDIYGIALDDPTLDAIYVTEDTVENARTINAERVKKGMKEMTIITAPLLEGDDDSIISSTKIRQGIMDVHGHSLVKIFEDTSVFNATPDVRDELRSPIGLSIQGHEENLTIAGKKVVDLLLQDNPPLVIAVGDVVTQTLHMLEHDPDISFVDGKTKRREMEETDHHPVAVVKHGPFKNEAGTISPEVVEEYLSIIDGIVENRAQDPQAKTYHQIIIDGEEDILGLPAMMLAPLGSVVLYGQYEMGIVYVRVDEELKHYCERLLERFEKKG